MPMSNTPGHTPGPVAESSETTGAGPGTVMGESTSPAQQGFIAEHMQGMDAAEGAYSADAAQAQAAAVSQREQEGRKIAMGM